jgi:hypothetical protein
MNFHLFEPSSAYLHSKLRKKANKSQKKNFFKNSIWCPKQGIYADFKSVEKFLKNVPKKLLAKMLRKNALFPLLVIFVKLVLLITFFVHLQQLFQRLILKKSINIKK